MSLPVRIRNEFRYVLTREEETSCHEIVDSTLVLLKSGVQGETDSFCVILRKAEDHTLEPAGVCLASSPHPLRNLRAGLMSSGHAYGIHVITGVYAHISSREAYNVPVLV